MRRINESPQGATPGRQVQSHNGACGTAATIEEASDQHRGVGCRRGDGCNRDFGGIGIGRRGAGPVERDQAAVAAGEEQFVASCAVCHGPDLLGSPTGPPLLVPTYAPNHHGDEAFQQAVAFGVPPHHWNFGPMAPIEGLSRDDVSQIVAYVRTMQEAEGIFIDPTH